MPAKQSSLSGRLITLPQKKYELQVEILNKSEGAEATSLLMAQIREIAMTQALADPTNTNETKRKNAVALLLRDNPKYQELETTQRALAREITMHRIRLEQLNDEIRVSIAILGASE
jgi:hypothetical protein